MSDVLEQIVLPDGEVVRLGNIIPKDAGPDDTKFLWTEFGTTEKAKLIPRSEWKSLMENYSEGPEHPHLPPVHNQNGVGQCNASATTAMMEFLRSMQGLKHVPLSAADLYHRINWGRDQGSLLEDAIREVMANGVGTVESSGYLWKSGHWKGEASSQERQRFRVLECYICPTFDHCMSAVFQGFALNSGIMWYDNYTPPPNGWLPAPRGRSGGHAIFGYKPAMRGNEFGIWHQNSWGVNWPSQGAGGRFVIPESAYRGPVGGWFAVRAITDEGGIIPSEK